MRPLLVVLFFLIVAVQIDLFLLLEYVHGASVHGRGANP